MAISLLCVVNFTNILLACLFGVVKSITDYTRKDKKGIAKICKVRYVYSSEFRSEQLRTLGVEVFEIKKLCVLCDLRGNFF